MRISRCGLTNFVRGVCVGESEVGRFRFGMAFSWCYLNGGAEKAAYCPLLSSLEFGEGINMPRRIQRQVRMSF